MRMEMSHCCWGMQVGKLIGYQRKAIRDGTSLLAATLRRVTILLR